MTSTTDTNKYRNWVFTFDLGPTHSGESDRQFIRLVLQIVASSYVFQLEQGEETKRYHFQGCFQTPYRIRHRTLLANIKSAMATAREDGSSDVLITHMTIDRMQGTWEEAQNYCTKKETSIGSPTFSPDLELYSGGDINFLEDQPSRFPWQDKIFKEIFASDEIHVKDADPRTILWITDEHGCSGKSKFVKFACYSNTNCAKVSFGSSTQLRSSLIALGRKKVYFIDIPRTMGKEDHLEDLITVLEDLKNGFLVSCMYGKYQSLMMDPPHVVVFSNVFAPFNMMSADRWRAYKIDRFTKDLLEEPHGRIHY